MSATLTRTFQRAAGEENFGFRLKNGKILRKITREVMVEATTVPAIAAMVRGSSGGDNGDGKAARVRAAAVGSAVVTGESRWWL